MKIRNGFISNSSSSSFIVYKKNLSKFQINAIHNHIEVYNIYKKHMQGLAQRLSEFGNDKLTDTSDYDQFSYNCSEPGNAWEINELEDEIIGRTDMNNFDIEHLFNLIGLKQHCDFIFKSY